jgi:hypothetical protein
MRTRRRAALGGTHPAIGRTSAATTDEDGHTYRFDAVTLRGRGVLRVRTGMGASSSTQLFWNLDNYVWNNSGDTGNPPQRRRQEDPRVQLQLQREHGLPKVDTVAKLTIIPPDSLARNVRLRREAVDGSRQIARA